MSIPFLKIPEAIKKELEKGLKNLESFFVTSSPPVKLADDDVLKGILLDAKKHRVEEETEKKKARGENVNDQEIKKITDMVNNDFNEDMKVVDKKAHEKYSKQFANAVMPLINILKKYQVLVAPLIATITGKSKEQVKGEIQTLSDSFKPKGP